MTQKHVRIFQELGYAAPPVAEDYVVSYEVFEIAGWQDGDKPLFGSEFVDKLEDAQVFLHGDVKWDGCSNWYFDEQDRGMLHGCSKENLLSIGGVMAACWDWSAELMPNWSPD